MDSFIARMQMIFHSQPNTYNTDEKRIYTFASFFSGMAEQWFTVLLRNRASNLSTFASFESFLEVFVNRFQEPNLISRVTNELEHLRQKEASVTRYVETFLELSSYLDWNEAALISTFRRGLKDIFKDYLLTQPRPSSLAQLVGQVQDINQRLLEREMERNSRYKSNPPRQRFNQTNSATHSSLQQQPILHGPIPMEIDRGNRRTQTHLSEAERTRRYEEGLCAYCGSAEHVRISCPLRLERQRRINLVSSSSSHLPSSTPKTLVISPASMELNQSSR